MASLLDLARSHQEARKKLVDNTAETAVGLFQQANVHYLDASWDALAPYLLAEVTAAQVTAARQATPYLDAIGGSSTKLKLVPEALGGVAGDGRELAPAMFGSITHAKTLIGGGWSPEMAFQSGAAFLATVVKTAIADIGRMADDTVAANKGYTHYIRVVQPGACSRCAILAGKASASKPFLRHPNCHCTSMPSNQKTPAGFFHGPNDYFESLSATEQDRVFTKAGAFAIRNGADPVQVVNARRGASGIGYASHGGVTGAQRARLQKMTIGRRADGSPLQVYATQEGTTSRSQFGKGQIRLTDQYSKSETDRYRRTTTIRLMPEQIQVMAGDNPARARELLQRYGYLN
jgi:hypothetical protein